MDDAARPAGGSSRCPTGFGCSESSTRLLLWTNLGISLLVLVSAAYFGAVAEAGACGDARRRADRQRDARHRGADRRRRARALDGAPARAARPPRLLPRDRPERAAVPRLVGVRAHRSSRRRRARCATALFGFHPVWVWKLVFGGLALAMALLGPIGFVRQVRAQGRDLGRARLRRLPRLVDPRARPPAPTLGHGRRTAARSGSASTS